MSFRRLHAFGLGAIAAGVAAALLVLVPARRIGPERHLAIPERLDAPARRALDAEMHDHARAMRELTAAVTLLDWRVAEATAARVAAEPLVGRQADPRLPARFFALQDELHAQLVALGRAAAAHDAAALADAFAGASRTCVQCHDAWLGGR